MDSSFADLDLIKQKMRATWMTGDFGKVAAYAAPGAEEFIERLHLQPGSRVLDVACGSGNLAIPAARRGAVVTGIDIAPNLLEQARQRAAHEGISATFQEADAEQLPFADASFDFVVSMFGAMFAPRPELVAAELLRVCRPGGTLAMANWTREGFVGQMFATTARHAPPPPGPPSPLLWGHEATARELLTSGCSNLSFARRNLVLEYPFPPADVVSFYREYYGPTATTFARLDPTAQAALTADLEAMWSAQNQALGTHTRVYAEYLEIIAVRA